MRDADGTLLFWMSDTGNPETPPEISVSAACTGSVHVSVNAHDVDVPLRERTDVAGYAVFNVFNGLQGCPATRLTSVAVARL
jgi:hypothetical protein